MWGALQHLREHGIKLKPSKFELFKPEVWSLGKIVSDEGSNINPVDTAAVIVLKDKQSGIIGVLKDILGFWVIYSSISKIFNVLPVPCMTYLKHLRRLKPLQIKTGGWNQKETPEESRPVPPLSWKMFLYWWFQPGTGNSIVSKAGWKALCDCLWPKYLNYSQEKWSSTFRQVIILCP